MTRREYMHILNMQGELERRGYIKILVKTYNFFGEDFILVKTGLNGDEESIVLIDCSLAFIERCGLKETIDLFEKFRKREKSKEV